MVTASTYKRDLIFKPQQKVQFLHDSLLDTAEEFGWQLQAWAVFPNHYHFLSISPGNPENLTYFIRKLHGATSKHINAIDNTPGIKVWYQFWDSRITYQASYYARLNYVHNNAVHHGIVENSVNYKWCSAAWFERTAEKSFYKIVSGFKTDRIKVKDVFFSKNHYFANLDCGDSSPLLRTRRRYERSISRE